MCDVEFEPDQKIAIFDKIAENYFNRNFGTMSKSDFETLLFAIYVDNYTKRYPYSEFALSKQLGITQARVRTLQERKGLKYPRTEFNWQKDLDQVVSWARYDEKDNYIRMIIQDVNVLNELRYYIESHGWYDEYTLNKRMLKIPLECFLEIFYSKSEFENDFSDESKQKIKKIAEKYDKDNETLKIAIAQFSKEHSWDSFKKLLSVAGKELLVEILEESNLPASLKGIAKVIKKAIV